LALGFNFLFRLVNHKELSLLDKIFLYPIKALIFPVIIWWQGNSWVVAIMISIGVYLSFLDLHPVLAIGSRLLAGIFGLGLILMLYF